MDLSNIKPWNTGEFPVRVNNIRFNQDYTLFSLATSRGYKIFCSKTLLQVQEQTELVRNFGDLNIVMNYYSTNIVFFTAKKNNPNFTMKELIIFDDFSQKIISKFISKKEIIIDFFVSDNSIYIALQNKVIVLELLTLKVINIIENVEINHKLLSYNNNDILGYTLQNTYRTAFVEFYYFKNHIKYLFGKKQINFYFEFAQLIEISPSGTYIAIVSILGNKIHIYSIPDNKLIDCILIGTKVINIEKISFINNKENYILLNINNKKSSIYKINNKNLAPGFCICSKYSEDDIINGRIKLDNDFSFFDYFWVRKNDDVRESHLSLSTPNLILFSDFFFILKKSFVIIDREGYYYIYYILKEKTNLLPPHASCKWI